MRRVSDVTAVRTKAHEASFTCSTAETVLGADDLVVAGRRSPAGRFVHTD